MKNTSDSNFLPFVQGVSWEDIREGYPNLPGILFQLRLRNILLEDRDSLNLLLEIIRESPKRISVGLSRETFFPENWLVTFSQEQGLFFWFRMLDYIEKTEPAALAAVLGNPKKLQCEIPGNPIRILAASTQKIWAALIEKSPYPEACWFKINWRPQATVTMFSEHKVPSLPFYEEQTGVTYVVRQEESLPEKVIHISVSSPSRTYATG